MGKKVKVKNDIYWEKNKRRAERREISNTLKGGQVDTRVGTGGGKTKRVSYLNSN